MRLLIAGDFRWNSGSSHVVREYVRHGPSLGIEVAISSVLGTRDETITRKLPYCSDLGWGTHLLVVLEGNPFVTAKGCEAIDRVFPRSRRAVLDADGHWGPVTSVGDDDNTWPCGQEAWRAQINSIADLVLQPSLLEPSAGAVRFSYFGMPPREQTPVRPAAPRTELSLQYIGSNWFRFKSLLEVCAAARAALGSDAKLRVCGTYWDGRVRSGFEAATCADTVALARLGVEVREPVAFGTVVECMGDAIVSPVLVRPVLTKRGFLTPRMFETAAAATLPVYREGDRVVSALYQDDGEFCLGQAPTARLREIVERRGHLRKRADELREHLYSLYSYPTVLRRLRDLLA